MKDDIVEHVAKKLCRAAIYYDPKLEDRNISCQICQNDVNLCIWKSFVPEANAAIEAVKDFAILSLRRKPKI